MALKYFFDHEKKEIVVYNVLSLTSKEKEKLQYLKEMNAKDGYIIVEATEEQKKAKREADEKKKSGKKMKLDEKFIKDYIKYDTDVTAKENYDNKYNEQAKDPKTGELKTTTDKNGTPKPKIKGFLGAKQWFVKTYPIDIDSAIKELKLSANDKEELNKKLDKAKKKDENTDLNGVKRVFYWNYKFQ